MKSLRSHFLKEIDLESSGEVLKRFPDFDFYKLGNIQKLVLEFSESEIDSSVVIKLSLEMSYPALNPSSMIHMQLEGISELELGAVKSGYGFSELELSDLRSAMLEGVRYELRDCGPDGYFVCQCSKLTISIA